jgi:hypothetical protein
MRLDPVNTVPPSGVEDCFDLRFGHRHYYQEFK